MSGDSRNTTHHDAWFPGRLIGGVSLVVGPVAWLSGLLLRHLVLRTGALTPEQLAAFAEEPFAAPSQLAAYVGEPALVTAAYAAFFAGTILLWPAIVTLAQIIAARSPRLAYWGGTLFVLGLFGRAYHAGVDQTAFQLTHVLGLEQATSAVSETYVAISYGPWFVPVTASACQYLGTVLLVIAAYRSATFGVGRCLVFLWAGVMWGGVLKASHLYDVVRAGLLCLVLVPLGVAVLRDRVPVLRTRLLSAAYAGPGRPRLLGW
jgi:hypothetical protein